MKNISRRYIGGFTLIELLVVVLIIGILSAVALPQYNKAVEKSKATQAFVLAKAIYQGAQVYNLSNGEWPTKLEDLDLSTPWEGEDSWSEIGYLQATSNGVWSLELYNQDSTRQNVQIGRLSGPYAMAGFQIWNKYINNQMPIGEFVCIEHINRSKFKKNPGDYCEKIFNATYLFSGTRWRYYRMPL